MKHESYERLFALVIPLLLVILAAIYLPRVVNTIQTRITQSVKSVERVESAY